MMIACMIIWRIEPGLLSREIKPKITPRTAKTRVKVQAQPIPLHSPHAKISESTPRIMKMIPRNPAMAPNRLPIMPNGIIIIAPNANMPSPERRRIRPPKASSTAIIVTPVGLVFCITFPNPSIP